MKISLIKSRQILDSRGNPTVEVDVKLEDNSFGRAAVPSGASTGSNEAVELRDCEESYQGKSVQKACNNVNTVITEALSGVDALNQKLIDDILCQTDATENKSNLGANATLAVSLAVAKAAAQSKNIKLYEYVAELANEENPSLPMPMMNLMNGGQHADNTSDIQEYMIIPKSADTMAEAIEMGANIFHNLKKVLKNAGYSTAVGDEGGYAPRLKNGNHEPLSHITDAIEMSGYEAGKDVVLALDVAASEFYADEFYHLGTENMTLSSQETIEWLKLLANRYPIVSIEDGLDESDWANWSRLLKQLPHLQLVGDDLLVTNTKLLQRGIDEKSANAVLIKPNQIGTLTQTIDAVKMAKDAGWKTVMSHRSGETEDTTISHLAVGLNTGQIKTGSLSRTDRVAKYNELLRIAEQNPNLKLSKPF